MKIYYLLLMVVLAATSCVRESPKVAVISWSGAGGIDAVSWSVDGKSVGKGANGYTMVLKHINSLVDHARIRAVYPFEFWNEDIDGFKQDDPFPFKERHDLREQFDSICQKKDLTIEFVRAKK